jgi:diamine N-acetyltransferase
MNPLYNIQPASIGDAPVIQQIAHTTWPATYGHILSNDQLAYMLDLIYSIRGIEQAFARGEHFVLLYDQQRAVGFASFGCIESPAVYKLFKLYILPSAQGTGAGKLLLDHVATTCQQAGAILLQLNVNRHNKAKDFYEKHGFAVAYEEDIDIGNGYLINDYVMEKPL